MSETRVATHARVLQSKLTRPVLPDGMVDRPRLIARFVPTARVVLVAAPPGFGKTTLVAQWTAVAPAPLAWISVDLLDESPAGFWRHLIHAVRSVVPVVDDAARAALDENPGSCLFLSVLIAQLEHFDGHAVVVLDSYSRVSDRAIADGLALLAERVGHRLQLVITTRVDPPLPLARWRTQGWLAEIRERDLRLRDEEALGVAATFRGLGLPDEVYLRVNRRADGWPIAFHLALVSAQHAEDPEDGLRAMASSDRELSDFVVAEILDHLPVDEREVVLDLSVVEWFDPDAAVELAGPRAGAAIVELRRRRLLITDVPGRPDAMRFHPLFRELLEAELRWRDPARHHAVHRLAAAMWQRRGDIPSAYRRVVAVGDITAHDDPLVLLEHLTAREMTILELLPTHLSYAQIAERLYVSVNTVKSNLKAVYRKLGVSTRSDAVAAARAAGLVSRDLVQTAVAT
ncbi:MAG: LuxR C-terminal-related transcriptional regulator [Ilumatobacteraceae bacterium]